ncbi:UvrD-helicase domain-containing protein [Fervidibacter sacchari]
MCEQRTVPWLCDEEGNPLDEYQRELAVSDDANLIINAGPGSGKTRVLIAHYLHLLMTRKDWDIESVVAITFTEKAAAEMKERISRVLLRVRRVAELTEWRERASEILEHLPEAPIGTIHSFCARLLRRFALDAGVDPSFRILDELEAQTLRGRVCERWLWQNISSQSLRSEDAQKVVGHWGFNRATESLSKMLELRLLIEYRKAKDEPIICRIGDLTDAEEALERCYESIVKAYDDEKAKINALDYDDLLLRTWKLLRDNETVRRQLRAMHRRILVDELQDTDRVQVEILRLICGWDEEEPTGILFFGVGDSQQSIYGFRNADVSVFNELWTKAETQRGWRRARLDKNYRSVPPIVELTNYTFERIFTVGEKADEVEQRMRMPLQRMEPVRPEPENFSPIEFAFFKVTGKVNKWQKLRLEAEWIAKRISELHGEGFAYMDIAVLLRELVNSTVYEDALRRHGIPYHIITGYGFFETMEARDLLTFLQVLSEPDNDVALASWLRSPMVGVSDETLFRIFGQNSSPSHNPLEDIPNDLPHSEQEKLQRAKKLLDEAKGKADILSVRELLEWVIRETSYDVIAAALPQGRQRLANIRKFVRLAQQLSEDLKLNIRGLTRYAKALLEGEVRIGEPPLAGATADAVQVMTIHAAKGLEFPVVIVPMLGEVKAPEGSGEILVATPDKGIGVRLYDDAGSSLKREDERMKRFVAVDEVRKIRERAESERLLFVAWTRAKDKLILVGTESEEQKKQSQQKGWANWLQLVADTLQVPVGEKRDEPFNVDGVSVWLKGETMSVDEARQRGKEFSQIETEAVKWLHEPESIPSLETPKFDLPDLMPSVLRLSVTDLIEKDERAKPRTNFREQTLPPQEAGLIVHYCLQRKITSPTDEQIKWIALAVGASVNAALAKASDLRKFVGNAAKSSAWQQAQKASDRWHELDFRVWLDGEPPIELTGRWDLIAKGDEWLVVDFKTDSVDSAEEAERLVNERYIVQAQAYALAAHKVFSADFVRVVFVFANSACPHEVVRCFTHKDWASIAESMRQKALSLAGVC